MTATFPTASSRLMSGNSGEAQAPEIPAGVLLKVAHRTLRRWFQGDQRALQDTHSSVQQWLVEHGYATEIHEVGGVSYHPTVKARRAMMI